MKLAQIFPAWRMILEGRRPFLSIELTRECPLRCPGCYAYAAGHAGGPLRSITDLKEAELIDGVFAVIERLRPLHVSFVGGEPLIRYRELNTILPWLAPLEVQIATSAVIRIPAAWAAWEHVHLVVSVDGLPREHNMRRTPADYDRILANIAGHQVIVHCTITNQMLTRPGYLSDFAAFWSGRAECRKIWFSLFTPQTGEFREERLTPETRQRAFDELSDLPAKFPKAYITQPVLEGFAHPPGSASECIFARVTTCLSPDLKTEIRPCQLGGAPDCAECGCIAAAGFSAIGRYKLGGLIGVGEIFRASSQIGRSFGTMLAR